MTAKTKLEAVPTPAQLLREAIVRRDSTAAEIEAINARANRFAPIEAEVTAAQAELQAALQRDATAMQEWVQTGATGSAPEPDHKARESAARKLSEAIAKLNATGSAKAQIEADIQEAHGRHQAALQAARAAEAEVLGQEWIQSAHAFKAASIAYLTLEQHYFDTRIKLFDLDLAVANRLMSEVAEIVKPLTVEMQRELSQQTNAKTRSRLAALCQGSEPADAPQVTA